MCLCYDFQKQRLTNCFEFNHNMNYNCVGQNSCECRSQCFQDDPICSIRSVCMCPPCFYGTQCQFSVNEFGLSLDAILGYHIQRNSDLLNQPTIALFSLTLTIIGSSITTLLTIVIFGLKFWILILAQMTIISNRLFLQIQCLSFDFLLRVCRTMDQWLNACAAMERAITVSKGINFNKKKSKCIAEIIIIILLIFTVSTNIYDSLYRRLIDEDNEDDERIWYIATYPSRLQTYNSFI
ncbi:unnamed protein product [Rotaria sp. Silwood1]|nr:unnamed protein product [Rotaria sp. Silwood1]CAF1353276.1 unnamed protein product [Rotaria sp. Silwood1]CAF1355726.1 unnamed protein product [Rotaria sp. Silwood1]CAF3514476.1 unnamed protein product [Rotaria sp. Silwood1]CAF3575744.1 unnamed protein product [Rotaria sp. Silwood1]